VFSERSDGDLRVSSRGAGEPLTVVQKRVVALLGVDGVAVPRQVHGAQVAVLGERPEGYLVAVAQADGLVTSIRGAAAGVHVADCLPIAIGGDGGVAMLHAGWRGLADGIVDHGVAALRALGVEGALEALVGPGAGGCCYETGDELHERFAAYGASAGRMLDLKVVATGALHEAGVARVHDIGLCTICAPGERFFSHRREGAATGRQGGFAWLR